VNVEETIAVIEALRLAGVRRFKSRDIEVHFGAAGVRVAKRTPQAAQRVAGDVQTELPLNAENTKRAEDLIRTLRNPEKLMDAIFPDGAEGMDGV
jgi:hypothetical protein